MILHLATSTLFLDPEKQEQKQHKKKRVKVVSIAETKLLFTIRTKTNDSSFSYLVSVVLATGQLLPSPKEAVADPHQNICCSILLCNVTNSSNKPVADPIWVQLTIVTRYGIF